MNRKNGIRYGIVFLAVIAFFVTVLYNRTPPPLSTRDVVELRKELTELIVSKGGEKAYAAYKARYAKADPNSQHIGAHLFGEELYAIEGISGVVVCDTQIDYGCYHGFFMRAVTAEGIGVVPQLAAACRPDGDHGDCTHGVGHGLVEYLGPERLTEALAACDTMGPEDADATIGCHSGVFMEYNVPKSFTGEGDRIVSARPFFDSSKPYFPCTDVERKYDRACYHELPLLWGDIYNYTYERMGALCEAIATPLNQRVCFAGISTMIPTAAEYSPEKIRELCDLMPEGKRSTCLMDTTAVLIDYGSDYKAAREVCAMLDSEQRETCLERI